MKKLFLATIMIMVMSCGEISMPKRYSVNNAYEHDAGTIWTSVGYAIVERTIDSCQYIIVVGTDNNNIIHKANCKNSIHKK